jgi:hypothetical protein
LVILASWYAIRVDNDLPRHTEHWEKVGREIGVESLAKAVKAKG